jgi:hypothetical protein
MLSLPRRRSTGSLSAAAARRAVTMAVLLLPLAASACAPSVPGDRSSCLLPSQKPMVIAELFFGRDIPGRPPLTAAEWSEFSARILTKEFPDGFTSFDGEGQWRDPSTGAIVREPAKIVIVAVDPASDVKARLDAVISAYRRQFNQRSVGLVSAPGCGAF